MRPYKKHTNASRNDVRKERTESAKMTGRGVCVQVCGRRMGGIDLKHNERVKLVVSRYQSIAFNEI